MAQKTLCSQVFLPIDASPGQGFIEANSAVSKVLPAITACVASVGTGLGFWHILWCSG